MSEREASTIRMPEELKKSIAQTATDMGLSFNALVLIILQEFLQKQCR